MLVGRLLVTATLLMCACVRDATMPVAESAENRGTQLATGEDVALFGEFGWSADGQSIYYQPDIGDPPLKLISLAGGAPQVVDEPRDEYVDLRTAPSGAAIYFLANEQSSRRTAYRLPPGGGAATVIGNTVTTRAARVAQGTLLLPSPVTDSVAVIIAPDSLFLAGAEGRRFISRNSCDRLIVFSPAGDALLCQRGSTAATGYNIVNLATGDANPQTLLTESEGLLLMVNWSAAESLEVFYFGSGAYRVKDVFPPGEMSPIWTLPRANTVVDFEHMAWSADGSTFAFWTHVCLDRAINAGCARGQSLLHVIDRTSFTDRVVAVATGTVGGQSIAFSSDGTRIAYVFEKGIYHVPAR